jgi:hypothetical protein
VTVRQLDSLKVVPYTVKHIPNPYPGGVLPWQAYHTVRNDLVRVCRRHGTTGLMGELKVDEEFEDLNEYLMEHDLKVWEPGDEDPTYCIIDDQYNSERYCYAELYGDDTFNAGWLLDLTETLREHKGWGLGIQNIPNHYVLIFGTRLLVTGRRLRRCRSASEVVDTVRQLLSAGDKRWWEFWR